MKQSLPRWRRPTDIGASCLREPSSVSKPPRSRGLLSCRISRVRFAFVDDDRGQLNYTLHARRRFEEIITRDPCRSVSSMRTDPCLSVSYGQVDEKREQRACVDIGVCDAMRTRVYGTSRYNASMPNLWEREERGSKEVVYVKSRAV